MIQVLLSVPLDGTNFRTITLVRGQFPQEARFEDRSFPIPLYKDAIVSLYDLQERSREGEMAAN